MLRLGPLLLAACVAACGTVPPPVEPTPPASATEPPPTASPAPTIGPLARPGNEVAYVAGIDPQIHLLDLSTGESRQLTHLTPEHAQLSGAAPVRPALSCSTGPSGLTWSPDGRLLAFSYGACDTVVWVVDLEGTLRRIGDGRGPSWTPDGSALVFAANQPWCPSGRPSDCGGRPGAMSLLVAEADGEARAKPLAVDGSTDEGNQPHVSPDGALVAFAGPLPPGDDEPGLFSATYVIGADGAGRRLIARGAWPAGWLRDGRVLIVDERSGDLRAVDLSTADAELIGGDAGLGVAPPNGAGFLFTESEPATGSLLVRLTRSDGTVVVELGPAFPAGWAPDGTTALVFATDGPALVLVDVDGHEVARHELPGAVPFGGAAWRPVP